MLFSEEEFRSAVVILPCAVKFRSPPSPDPDPAKIKPPVVSIEPPVLSMLILPALPLPLISGIPSSSTKNSPDFVVISVVVIFPTAFISMLPPFLSIDEVSNEFVRIFPEIA